MCDILLGFLNVVIVILTLFLIILILIQRGKGGGLAGAFGGMGGSSAFGAGPATSSPRSPWVWPSPGSCCRCSWSSLPTAKPPSDWVDDTARDRDRSTRTSKRKSKGPGGTRHRHQAAGSTARNPLPADLKVSELPDSLEHCPSPSKKNCAAWIDVDTVHSRPRLGRSRRGIVRRSRSPVES